MLLIDRCKRIAAANHVDPGPPSSRPDVHNRPPSAAAASRVADTGECGGEEDLDEPDLRLQRPGRPGHWRRQRHGAGDGTHVRRERRLRRAGRPRRRSCREGGRADRHRGRHRDRHRLRRRRRSAGGRDGRPRGRRVRPARHGVQQCRHPGAAVGCRRRAGRELRPRHRHQPAGRLGLHEARAARDARARERRDRQLLVAWAASSASRSAQPITAPSMPCSA